jgi:hypothetical protein
MIRMDVVIPVAHESKNIWLPLALESIRRNAPQLSVILIGHTPPWIEEPYIRRFIHLEQHPNHPVENTDMLMRAACNDSHISDPFLWSNDDIFWRRPVEWPELILQSGAAMKSLRDKQQGTFYGDFAHETAFYLEKAGLPIFDYERHVPLIVLKEQMLRALDFGWSKRSVYGNQMRAQPTMLTGDTKLFNRPNERVDPAPWLSVTPSYPMDRALAILGL